MPNYDKSGPQGQGPATGKGEGGCRRNVQNDNAQGGVCGQGRGKGRGLGPGQGQGRGVANGGRGMGGRRRGRG